MHRFVKTVQRFIKWNLRGLGWSRWIFFTWCDFSILQKCTANWYAQFVSWPKCQALCFRWKLNQPSSQHLDKTPSGQSLRFTTLWPNANEKLEPNSENRLKTCQCAQSLSRFKLLHFEYAAANHYKGASSFVFLFEKTRYLISIASQILQVLQIAVKIICSERTVRKGPKNLISSSSFNYRT